MDVVAVFKKFDRDGNGTLEKKEIRAALQELGVDLEPLLPSSERANILLKKYDADGSGTLDLSEFTKLMQALKDPPAVFAQFDRDCSGKLENTELRLAMQELGVDPSSERATALLKTYDADSSGTLDLGEFTKLMQAFQDPATVFARFDRDGSGMLDNKELYLAMHELGVDPTSERAKLLLKKYDADGSGTLGLGEFTKLMQALQDPVAVFAKFDRDGSGKLDNNELRLAMQELGVDPMSERANALLKKYDADSSGTLDLGEFTKLLGALQDPETVFAKFDRDSSGNLDYKELRLALQELEVDPWSERATALLKKYDADSSGTLDLGEFKGLLQSLQLPSASIAAEGTKARLGIAADGAKANVAADGTKASIAANGTKEKLDLLEQAILSHQDQFISGVVKSIRAFHAELPGAPLQQQAKPSCCRRICNTLSCRRGKARPDGKTSSEQTSLLSIREHVDDVRKSMLLEFDRINSNLEAVGKQVTTAPPMANGDGTRSVLQRLDRFDVDLKNTLAKMSQVDPSKLVGATTPIREEQQQLGSKPTRPGGFPWRRPGQQPMAAPVAPPSPDVQAPSVFQFADLTARLHNEAYSPTFRTVPEESVKKEDVVTLNNKQEAVTPVQNSEHLSQCATLGNEAPVSQLDPVDTVRTALLKARAANGSTTAAEGASIGTSTWASQR